MLTEETYPSGRKIKNTFQTDGDIAKIETMQTGGNWQIRADNFNYAAHGAIKHLQIGNGLWETAQFNNRLQVTQLGLGNSSTDTSLWKLDYDFGATDNNGNIKAQTVTSPVGTYSQSFTYDALDRLKTANETSGGNQTWTQSFTYDRYGNRAGFSQTLNGQTTNTTPTIDPNTNRFNLGQGYTYDAAGNVITDNQGRSFVFNGDNKQVEVKDASNQTVGQYFYDGDGKRIKKISAQETTTFVYSGGKLVAEYQLTNQTPTTATTQYLGTDMLGSPRVVSDQTGAVVSRRDFMPYGEELTRANYGSDTIRQKFTGYEKDTETGLDFAEARYYNSNLGRFTAVDPLLASGKSADPRTFNRYAYAGNNPVRRLDPNGTDWYESIQYKMRRDGTSFKVAVPYWSDDNFSGPKWSGGTIYGDNLGGITVLNSWENDFRVAGSMAEAKKYRQEFRNQAVLNFVAGILEANSIAFSLSGTAARLGVDEDSNTFRAGYNSGSVAQGVSALLGGGAIANAVANKFGRGALSVLKGVKLCCFEAGTPIHTDKGLKTIENIKVGDKVLSYNEKTKQLEYKKVASTFTGVKSSIVKLKIAGEKQQFTTTTEHPFYIRSDKDKGAWKTAENLKIGDEVLKPDGTWTQITEIQKDDKPTTVYNFEVEDNHSYFVGETGVLSHNCNIVIAGKNFKDHFIRHKGLIEGLTGNKYSKFKSHGAEFLSDVSQLINNNVLIFVGQGTLMKGGDVLNVYRGQGVTVITKTLQNGATEFVTALKTGEGKDLAIMGLNGKPL